MNWAFEPRLTPRRHLLNPWLLLSLGVHAGLGAFLLWFGSYELGQRDEERVGASLQATSVAPSAQRVEDLQKIRELLAESNGGAAPAPLKPSDTPADERELLARARELAREIDKLDQEFQAVELARLTEVPLEQARAQVQAQAEKAAPPEMPDGATAREEIAALEKKAIDALSRRQEQIQRKEQGVALAHPPGMGEGNANPADALGQGGQGQGIGSGSVAGRMGELLAQMGGGGVGESPLSLLYRPDDHRLFKGGRGNVPVVPPGRMVKGHGRIIGAGGEYANRFHVGNWHVIGPFEGRHGTGLFDNPSYPPEQAVLLDAVYRGKGDRLLKWEQVVGDEYPLIPPDKAEDAVYYGYAELSLEREQDLTVWIGADDDARVWLNGQVIWKGGDRGKQWFFDYIYNNTLRAPLTRQYNLSEGYTVARFKKGRNKVLFKLSNGPTRLFFSMVLSAPIN